MKNYLSKKKSFCKTERKKLPVMFHLAKHFIVEISLNFGALSAGIPWVDLFQTRGNK